MSKLRAAVSMVVVLVAATGVGTARAHAQRQPSTGATTVREALVRHAVPFERGGPADLDRQIRSYAIEDSPELFVIGFDVADSLRVSALDRKAGTWSHARLERQRQRSPAWDVGSILRIQHTDHHILLD